MLREEEPTTLISKDINSQREERLFVGHSDYIIFVSVLESERIVASSSDDCSIKIWNIDSAKCIETVKLKDYAAKVLLPSSKILIGWEGVPNLWAWSLENHRFLFKKNNVFPTIVKINVDDKSLLVGDKNGMVSCYSLINGDLNWSVKLYDGWIYAIKPC